MSEWKRQRAKECVPGGGEMTLRSVGGGSQAGLLPVTSRPRDNKLICLRSQTVS